MPVPSKATKLSTLSLLLAVVAGLVAFVAHPPEAEALDPGSSAVIAPIIGGTATLGVGALVVVADGLGIIDVGADPSDLAGYVWNAPSAVMRFFWGDDAEEDIVVAPSTSTTAGGGCWTLMAGATSPLGPPCVLPNDGYGGIDTHSGGLVLNEMLIEAALARGSTTGTIDWRMAWSSSSTASTSRFSLELFCVNGTSGGTTLVGTLPTWSASSGSGSVTGAVNASGCAAKDGVASLRFIDSFYDGGCCGYLGQYRMPTTAPTYVEAAPVHKLRVTKVCDGPDGEDTVEALSGTYLQADEDQPAIPSPVCPLGSLATSFTVHEGNATGVGGPLLLDWTAPDLEDPLLAAISDCLPGGTAYPCVVRLLKVTPNGLLECTRSDVNCLDFDVDLSTTDQYQCRWGVHTVALSQCAPARLREFATQDEEVTDTEQAQGPQTVEPPTVVDGDDESFVACVGGISWNPLNWVVKPVKCVLIWAFIPQTSMSTYATDVSDSWSGSLIDSGFDMFGEIAGAVPAFTDEATSGDCHGPSITFNGQTLYPADACAAPVATWATISRTTLTLLIVFGGAITLVNLLMSVWGGPQINSDSTGGAGEKEGQGRFVL